MDSEAKKKLKDYLDDLKRSQRDEWKKIINLNQEKFNQIKNQIRRKQDELSLLVKKKKALTISLKEFNEKSSKIQQELYELESEILKLRLRSKK
ncbi:MAG: hypothetical protein ACTSQI_02435 [Candidatus Helarchaeota archaeon]